jgi:hypothetical protein
VTYFYRNSIVPVIKVLMVPSVGGMYLEEFLSAVLIISVVSIMKIGIRHAGCSLKLGEELIEDRALLPVLPHRDSQVITTVPDSKMLSTCSTVDYYIVIVVKMQREEPHTRTSIQ